MKTQKTGPGGYRLDLDGLRGLAITLVVVFHIWFGRVSGGVDVFLTLSGYFFVASLCKHVVATSAGSGSTWAAALNPFGRLWRLARRLVPAMLTVLVAIVTLTIAVLPRARWESLGDEVIASALYFQNWHLALASQDYAAADSANSPMQHLWSMSVQGQFFAGTLVALLLAGAVVRAVGTRSGVFRRPAVVRGALAGVIALAALTSFAWALHRHGIDQSFTYYDTFARAWEPLLGGLLAVWMPRITLPQWIRNALAAIALVLIITCGWWISGVDEYPSAMALVPVGATVLLIWVGSGDPTRVGSWLAHPRIVWLGSIAYSLYLWHWPLLIFYLAWRYQSGVSIVEGTGIVAASLVLAYLTTKFVEIPLRSGRKKPHTDRRHGLVPGYAAALTCVLVVLTAGAGLAIQDWRSPATSLSAGAQNRDVELYPGARALWAGAPVPDVQLQPDALAVKDDWPISSADGVVSGWTDGSVRVGVYGALEATRTIALVGGSHSEHWLTALDEIGREQRFRVTTYLKVGCPLITDTILTPIGAEYPQCNEWSRMVMDQLAVDRPNVVVTTSTRPTEGEGSGDYIPSDYLDIFTEFRDRGQQVIAIRDTPWALGPHLTPPECLASGRSAADCGVDREQALSPVDPTLAIREQFPNMSFLDFSDALCDDTNCPAIVGNILVWHDYHHLTTAFVASLTEAMSDELQKALPGWW